MARLISEIMKDLKKVQVDFDSTGDRESVAKVIDSYHGLLNEAPDDPEILFQIGTGYLQLGMFGAGMVYFQRCLEFWPDNSHVWSNLGCCFRSIHILPEARDCFTKSLMCAEMPETYSNLASSYVNEDCPEEGLKYALKAMELDPEKPKNRWNAGLLYLELEDWEKGFSLYDAGFFCKERGLRNYTNSSPDTTPWWAP